MWSCGRDSLTESLIPDPLTYIVEHNMPHLMEAFLLHTGGKHHKAVRRSGFTPLHMAVSPAPKAA